MKIKQRFGSNRLRCAVQCLLFLAILAGFSYGTANLTYAAVPILVKDIDPEGSSIDNVGSPGIQWLGSTIFFPAIDGVHSDEIWRSDGTEAGTYMVKDIITGNNNDVSEIQLGTEYNGFLFFSSYSPSSGYELFRSDGTADGTFMVKDINPAASTDSNPETFAVVNNILYFGATDGSRGHELFRTDGTESGTYMVRDIYSGSNSSGPSDLVEMNNLLYFRATIDGTDYKLWQSDGTPGGTVAVPEGQPITSLDHLININSTLYYAGTDGSGDTELWRYNGIDNPERIAVINESDSSSPSQFAEVKETLFFTANDGSNGVELWRSNGTGAGTFLVKDINEGPGSSLPYSITPFDEGNSIFFFSATTSEEGRELWISNGTTEGTLPVVDIFPGSSSSNPSQLTVVGEKLYFTANDGEHGTELWETDGTAEGTILYDINPGAGSGSPAYLKNVNGTLYFFADNGIHDKELMKLEGSSYPLMASIEKQFGAMDEVITPIALILSDPDSDEDSLVVTATSTNHNILPDGGITVSGTGANRTISLSPEAGQLGTTTVRLSVSDGTNVSDFIFYAAWGSVGIGLARYENIYDAKTAAVDGDIILVAPGTYSGTGFRYINTGGKSITIKGIGGPAETVLDLQGSGTAFMINQPGGKAIIDGFTIKNGGGYLAGNGNDDDPTHYGGAMYVQDLSSIDSPVINNCIILNNQAGYGGGIYSLNSSPLIKNTTFIDNRSKNGGGAILSQGTGTVTVISSTFRNNSSIVKSGGAVSAVNLTIEQSRFIDNITESWGGGAIYTSGGHAITNSVFIGNSADVLGAVYIYSGSSGVISHSSFFNNSAGAAGALSVYGTGSTTLSNSILWGNKSTDVSADDSSGQISVYSGATLHVEYSDLEGGMDGINGIAASSGINLDIDPGFALEEDLRLLADSPCIDKGTLLPTGGQIIVDIDGNPRPLNGTGTALAFPDMGAYELAPGMPIAAVSPRTVNFIMMQDRDLPTEQTVTLRNNGVGTLSWDISLRTGTSNWLRVESDVNSVLAGESITLNLYIDGKEVALLSPGTHFGFVDIVDAADNTTVLQTVTVLLTINRTINVNSDAELGDFTTIQDGIDAAIDGDIVMVADGTYLETSISFDGKSITVLSENGSDYSIIDGNNSYRVFIFNSFEGSSSILQGFTIRNGSITGDGAGIFVDTGSSPTIVSCRFENNTATSDGGGLYSLGDNLTIRNCEFIGNQSNSYGGGLLLDGDNSVVDNSLFTSNTSGSGGGIAISGDDVLINSSTFTSNESSSGGGIYTLGVASSLAVYNSTFTSNTALLNQGGGVYIQAADSTVANSIFYGNATSHATNGQGSAIYVAGSNINITNCSLYDNPAGNTIFGALAIFSNYATITNTVVWQKTGTGLPLYDEYPSTSSISFTSTSNDSGDITLLDFPFLDPDNGDFRLNPESGLVDTGTTVNSLFSDRRGSLRPINGVGGSGAVFDIGAMEYSKYYGGVQGSEEDFTTKAFANLRIESPVVAVGYDYTIKWDDRDPFPFGDERIQQAGEYQVNLALINNFGHRIDLMTSTVQASPLGYTIPANFLPEHIGDWRLRLEMAADPNQYILSESINIQYKELNTYYFGTLIIAPEGANGELKPDFDDDTVVFWSDVTKRLYGIGGPKSVVITWYADEERTVPLPVVAFVTAPPVPKIHIAESMGVPLLPEGSRFDSVEIKFSETDASTSGTEFTASNEGWTVLLFRDNEGATPDDKEVFEVVRTLYWDHDDPNFPGDPVFPGENSADIGAEVTDNEHDESCGNGYVFFENTAIDAYGPNRSYDRASRQGAIFPVNLDFTGPIVDVGSELDDLVVIWYGKSTSIGVCWPSKPVRYTPQWPVAADPIYIDNKLGSGPLDPSLYGLLEDMVIYNQPDSDLPGFNPNEEHAAFFTAQSSIFPGIFPLRNDINRADTSEPYVLLKFISPQTGLWDMKAFHVFASNPGAPPPFTYATVAGYEINAPYPLNQFVYGPCLESFTNTADNVLKDKDSKMYSYKGDVDARVSYFYKLQPGFYYDLDGDLIQDAPDGTCIAWLDGADGNWDNTPQEATYAISWPLEVPTLFVGETLIDPKTQTGETVGLPEVGAQCVVDILYDDNGIGSSAKLIDPLQEYAVDYPLTNPEDQLSLDPKMDLSSGRFVFTALPYHLQTRLTYDPIAGNGTVKGMLKLKGTYESGVGEPFLLLNVLSGRERGIIATTLAEPAYSSKDPDFDTHLSTLNEMGRDIAGDGKITGYTSLKNADTKALTAGDASGTGYVTLGFNNDPDCPAPTMLSVIKVDCGLYTGDIKVIESTNPFEEKVTLHHNGDFGGNADSRAFQWRYLRADFPGDPDLPTGPDDTSWYEYTPYPDNGDTGTTLDPERKFFNGAVDTVIQGTGEQLLPDKWFSTRYYLNGVCAGNPADPVDPGNFSDWTEPQLYEGWIKRVMKKINLFDQKVTDFHTAEVNDIASMISLAGQRYEGDIALSDDPEHLQSLGIIETYETLLNRGLSLVSTDSQDLNMALLFASNRLADTYMLLGNEAYGDAADPTIGFSTESGQYGTQASSIFSFQNQVDSLLEEELVLLRGRDRDGVRPFYNRMVWNFTLGDGEVAYKENYNITDQDNDGDIDEFDAMIQFPQGHGDAWGHYLSAVKKYYLLLKNELFTWTPLAENILVAGVPVKVDYRDERKFAAAAAARAKTGAEIVNLTYRQHYTEDPEGQWQGYKDSDLTNTDPDTPRRAWGVDGWAKRAGQAALFDWVVANAILPTEYKTIELVATGGGMEVFDLTPVSYTPGSGELAVSVNGQLVGAGAYEETGASAVTFPDGLSSGDVVRFQVTPAYGIEKVDRSTVTELSDIASSYNSIEAEVDKANIGLNPMGLSKNAIPFDIDPLLVTNGQTHFEQIYARAVGAMNNAIGVFNHANQSTLLLRRQQDSLADFQRNIENMEADYTNRLIEVYGYPYPDDCGPNKTYPTEACQDSPDLYHYMYVDASNLMGVAAPKVHEFDVVVKDFEVNGAGGLEENSETVTFHISTDSRFGIIKPAEWLAGRKAPGEIQLTRSELLQTRGRFEKGLDDYDVLLDQIDRQAEMIAAQHDLNLAEISILNRATNEQISLNTQIYTARESQLRLRAQARQAAGFADAAAEAFSGVNGVLVGMTNGVIADFFAGARSLAKFAGMQISADRTKTADNKALIELGFQQSKEIISAETNIELTSLRSSFAIEQQLLQLESLIRSEASLRHEIYVLEEALQQSASRYLAVLAKGDRLLKDRLRFRQQTAAQIQDYRYKDMSFRIFRNDALQKYRAQFDLAARYVYLAAKAYDYETTLLDYNTMAGQTFLTDIVKQRTIGTVEGGVPLTGSGLADPMKRMWQNFQVLKPQLGINNPQIETNRFSLRQELLRIRMDTSSNATWRQALDSYRVPDLWEIPEFRRYCRPFAAEGIAQPGIVIPFSTSVTSGLNFFKWPLGGGDSYYSSTNFATKVRSVGVWFSNYSSIGLTQTPRIYLVPVGEDVLRTPSYNTQEIRTWQVVDQKLPTPFPIVESELEGNPSWIPSVDTISNEMFSIRKHSDFRAYHDSGYLTSSELQYDSRLIGRSVWNSRWLLIIPGQNLLYDADEALDTLIDGPYVIGGTGERSGYGISDIKIFFETYGYSGN